MHTRHMFAAWRGGGALDGTGWRAEQPQPVVVVVREDVEKAEGDARADVVDDAACSRCNQ